MSDCPYERVKLSHLVRQLTNPRKNEDTLAEPILKEVKELCKSSNQNIGAAYKFLQCGIGKSSSHERYLSLLLIDVLFERSSAFRKLLLNDFSYFKSSTLAFKGNVLPPPKHYATRLNDKSLEIVEKWYQKFGATILPLSLEYEAMKKLHKFPSVIHEEQQQQLISQERVNAIREKNILRDFRDMIPQLDRLIKEMENSFELLVPSDPLTAITTQTREKEPLTDETRQSPENENEARLTVLPPTSDDYSHLFDNMSSEDSETESSDESEETETNNESLNYKSFQGLRENGVHSLDYELQIPIFEKTDVQDNIDREALDAIIVPLIDCIKQLEKRFEPTLQSWRKDVDKMNCEGNSQRQHLQNYISSYLEHIEGLKQKFKELNINNDYIQLKKNKPRLSNAFKITKRKRHHFKRPPSKKSKVE